MAESATFNLDFQPFLMPSASISKSYLIETNLRNILSEKKGRKKYTSLGQKVEKLKKSLFHLPKKNFLEIFLNFFLMIFRFQSMLFNLVVSKTKSPNFLEISKNPLRTLAITQETRRALTPLLGTISKRFDGMSSIHPPA